jgi:hypothetical protein
VRDERVNISHAQHVTLADPTSPDGDMMAGRGVVTRHPQAVHYLTDNRRQVDPAERAVLGQLREGDVGEAVWWYARRQRIHAIDNRDDALQAAVDAWAADVAGGQHAVLFAWRRANVEALNERAREASPMGGGTRPAVAGPASGHQRSHLMVGTPRRRRPTMAHPRGA